jgi:cellulose synthase/poly-beta-1,6-N-acetylglucosamine synthase-like glycosyltransferase
MTEKINFNATKQYLREGQIPEEGLDDLSINQIQALILRREAILAENDDNDEAKELRKKSREVLARSTDFLDFSVLEHIISDQEIDYEYVMDFLDELGLETLPILSNTPDELKKVFGERFDLSLISPDQINITDFDNIISESPVPQSISDAPIKRKDYERTFAESLKARWFLVLIVLLAVFSAVGFSLDWSLGLENVIGPLDLYLSIYGVTAIARSGWQMKRAEQWNRKARGVVRSEYAISLDHLTSGYPQIRDNPELIEQGTEVSESRSTWATYQDEFGLTDEEGNDGVLDKIMQEIDTEKSKDTMTDELAADIIKRNFGEKPPTVAVIIPTYKTSIDEMSELLISIKNQAYPIGDVYLAYNDNPNDPDPAKRKAKQDEYAAFDRLVKKINAMDGKNDCNILLLAQPSRGKREAMAMGFALSCGEKYTDVQHPEAEIANLINIPPKSHDFTLNIDSDTRIADKFALLNSMLMMNRTDPETGRKPSALTGDVQVINRDINLLSEMTYQRYKRAFFVERAAQSLTGDVTCLSGPWVLIDNDDLAPILDDWYYQEFLDQRGTYGDDRNISTLLNEQGKDVIFCPDSKVETDCPTDWPTFLKQQLRWNKSFNRENLRLFPVLHNLDKFVQLDVVYQQTFAFAMLYIMANITGNAVMTGIETGALEGIKTIIPYATIVLIYNELFFGLYGALSNDKDLKFFLSPVYIGYHFSALLWLKIYAFFKMKDTSWGTKGADQDTVMEEFDEAKETIIGELMEEIRADLPDNINDEE